MKIRYISLFSEFIKLHINMLHLKIQRNLIKLLSILFNLSYLLVMTYLKMAVQMYFTTIK